MTRAEQFAFFEINEPSFAEFCPMVQRYGEFVNRSRAVRAAAQKRVMPWTSEKATHTQCLDLLSKKAPRTKQGQWFQAASSESEPSSIFRCVTRQLVTQF